MHTYNFTHSWKYVATLNHPNLNILRNAVQQQYSFKVRNVFFGPPGIKSKVMLTKLGRLGTKLGISSRVNCFSDDRLFFQLR